MYITTTVVDWDCNLRGGIYEFLIDLNIRFKTCFKEAE